MLERSLGVLKAAVRDLFPGIFALVMATGIISIACNLLGFKTLALVLFQLNKAAFLVLWLMVLGRLIFYPQQLAADLKSHGRAPGFFTLVAGTCVLGSQYVLLAGDHPVGRLLWLLGLALWLLLMYTVLTALTVSNTKPTLETGINGAWLIAIVATQSISVLGTLLAGQLGDWKEAMLFFTLSINLLGFFIYIPVMTLIFYRWIFFPLEANQLTPTYWISMGAIAISTLAGDNLMLNAGQWGFLQELLPFLKGMTILYWATATFWIPLLVLMGIWRHIYKRYPLRYDPQFWGIVFPLGMYTTCSFQLIRATGLQFLYIVPQVFIYISLAAWLLAALGLIFNIGASFSSHLGSDPVVQEKERRGA